MPIMPELPPFAVCPACGTPVDAVVTRVPGNLIGWKKYVAVEPCGHEVTDQQKAEMFAGGRGLFCAEWHVLTLTEFLLARIREEELEPGCEGYGEYRSCYENSEHREREAAAKRQIVEAFPDAGPDGDGWNEAGLRVLQLLGSVYSEHPHYRDEWRTDTPEDG